MIGKTISHYRIIEKLGEGGMGVVYKAEDIKLKRTVALKFLSPELTRDTEANERFIQEAQAASALDHPNICTIHEIDETEEDQLFIVMTYYEGEILKKKIERGKLELEQIIDIVVQVAQGLAIAHEKGIIHRDIKPANIMITERDEVKILDFGLAKLAGAKSRLTITGKTLGTVAYMSPQQAQNLPVDCRTDIWSLGVVLYEMFTRQLPFKGESDLPVMYSIVNDEPEPVHKYCPDLSPEFLYMLNRALEKDPQDRYQTANDLLIDLRRLKRDIDKVSPKSPRKLPDSKIQRTPAVPIVHAKKRAYLYTAVLIALVAVMGYLLWRSAGESPVPKLINPTPVSTMTYDENWPTWAPDGVRLAYEWAGNIWVTQVPGGSPVNLTGDNKGWDQHPSWSPDGRQIAFYSSRDGGGFFIMPAIGGTPRKVPTSLPIPDDSHSWSPDGNELVFIVNDTTGAQVAEIVSLKGATSRLLQLPGEKFQYRWDISWSPDRRYLAYVVGGGVGMLDNTQLWIKQMADGKAFPVTDWQAQNWRPSWSRDSKYLYFVSNRGGSMDLWRLWITGDSASNRMPQRITTGLNIQYAAFSPDGNKLAYTKGQRVGNIWRVPIPQTGSHPATWEDARQLTDQQSDIFVIDISPDGKRLVFDSDRDGKWRLWMMPVQGGEMQRVMIDTMKQICPAWSPDGQEIAYVSQGGDNWGIWVVPVSGGPARHVASNDEHIRHPAWSPDGRKIAFRSSRAGNADIWIIPAKGGEAQQVTIHPAADNMPTWSPDGKWLIFGSDRKGKDSWDSWDSWLWRVRAAGGLPEPVTKASGWSSVCSPDGKKIYYISQREGGRQICEVPAEGGTERPVTNLVGKSGFMGLPALATDGQSLFFVWQESFTDLWVMDVIENH